MKRTAKKDVGEKGQLGEGPNLYLFKYYSVVDPTDDPEKFTIEVRGASRRDAMANFREKFEESDWNILEIKDINITDNSASRAQAQASAQASGVYRITDNNGSYLATIMADNPMDAYSKAIQRVTAAGLADGSWKLMAPGGRQIYPDPAFGSSGSSQNRRETDDLPELPGEFVADPMAAGTYIIKYIDPDGSVQRTAVDANSADSAREWFQSNHPSTYRVTDVFRHTA
jgi:hypothetical protein